MNDDPKVWLSSRKLKSGKTSYYLRWMCPQARRWKNEKAGTDKRRAMHKAAVLEKSLLDGTHVGTEKIGWQAFVDDHVAKIPGKAHAQLARRVLTDFGTVCGVTEPRRVRFTDLERYEAELQKRKRSPATINKARRYLHGAFAMAVKRGYAGRNPVTEWKQLREAKPEKRILKPAEETKLLASVTAMYGSQLHTFTRFLLATWARLSEATGMAWSDVNFEDGSVYFRSTKSHEDRYVPIARETGVLDDLRRLQAATLKDGGPFRGIADRSTLYAKWHGVIDDAGIDPVTFHDLRRTGVTRALLAGMPLPVVQRVAGHKDLSTTMRYYTEVTNRDVREWVNRIARVG